MNKTAEYKNNSGYDILWGVNTAICMADHANLVEPTHREDGILNYLRKTARCGADL
jgi:hypothetical protein